MGSQPPAGGAGAAEGGSPPSEGRGRRLCHPHLSCTTAGSACSRQPHKQRWDGNLSSWLMRGPTFPGPRPARPCADPERELRALRRGDHPPAEAAAAPGVAEGRGLRGEGGGGERRYQLLEHCASCPDSLGWAGAQARRAQRRPWPRPEPLQFGPVLSPHISAARLPGRQVEVASDRHGHALKSSQIDSASH